VSVYGPLSHGRGVAPVSSAEDRRYPRVVVRLPALPDATKPPLARVVGAAGPHHVSTTSLGGRHKDRRSVSPLAKSRSPSPAAIDGLSAAAHITSQPVTSLQQRMGLIPSRAAAADGASSLPSSMAPSNPGQQLERDKMDTSAATSSSRAGAAGDIARIKKASALTYQSPLERAHAEIVGSQKRVAQQTIDSMVAATANSDLGAPNTTLPSYWPPDVVLLARSRGASRP
jgi:hypothetical protein